MKAQDILNIWNRAVRESDFYAAIERDLGFTRAQLAAFFRDWNALKHEDAEAIAVKHGLNVREGGFQAYLADRI